MGIVNGIEVSLLTVSTNEFCTFKIQKVGGYSFNIYVCKVPTQNCQLSSIGLVVNLLQNTLSNRVDVQAVIRECYRLINYTPFLILMDVKVVYGVGGVEKCFEVLNNQPYTSSNGSNMCLYIVKLDPAPIPPTIVPIAQAVVPATSIFTSGFAPDNSIPATSLFSQLDPVPTYWQSIYWPSPHVGRRRG